jgi:hypothetical protein
MTWTIGCIEECQRDYPSEDQWLSEGDKDGLYQMVNNDQWIGNYTQDKMGFFIPRFTLKFCKDGTCHGHGNDNIGEYTLKGRKNGKRVALTKTYKPSFENTFHNRGHDVFIRMEATDQDRLVGHWYINGLGGDKMVFNEYN